MNGYKPNFSGFQIGGYAGPDPWTTNFSIPTAGIENLGLGGYLSGQANMLPGWGMTQLGAGYDALSSLFTRDEDQPGAPFQKSLSGAMAGSYFGPWGTAIGATIGLLGGKR
jgi:hypothetical protein